MHHTGGQSTFVGDSSLTPMAFVYSRTWEQGSGDSKYLDLKRMSLQPAPLKVQSEVTPQYSGYSYGRVTHLIRKASAVAGRFESPASETKLL